MATELTQQHERAVEECNAQKRAYTYRPRADKFYAVTYLPYAESAGYTQMMRYPTYQAYTLLENGTRLPYIN